MHHDTSSKPESKHAHNWFIDAIAPELFGNKKQAIEPVESRPLSGIADINVSPFYQKINVSPWHNASSFQSVSGQFADRLFESEPMRTVNMVDRNIEDAPCLSFGGIRKVKVNQVKDSNNAMPTSAGHPYSIGVNSIASMPTVYSTSGNNSILLDPTYGSGDENTISMGPTFTKADANFISMGHTINKRDADFISVGHNYDKGNERAPSFDKEDDPVQPPYHNAECNITTMAPTQCKGESGILSMHQNYNKGGSNTISFGGFFDESETNPSGSIISGYDLLMNNQNSVQASELPSQQQLVQSNPEINVNSAPKAREGHMINLPDELEHAEWIQEELEQSESKGQYLQKKGRDKLYMKKKNHTMVESTDLSAIKKQIDDLKKIVQQANEETNPPKWWEAQDKRISSLESGMTTTQSYMEQILGMLTGRTEEQVQNNPGIEQMLHMAIEDTKDRYQVFDKLPKPKVDVPVQQSYLWYSSSSGDSDSQVTRFYKDKEQPVAGNYYLINLGIYTVDKKFELSMLVDRATGGSSIKDGEIELMLHRRMIADNSKGVGEVLDKSVSARTTNEGEWVPVVVDDWIPCESHGEPAFTTSKKANELWVSILEKVYAKLHGSYEALEGGLVQDALVDLTGGVGEEIDIRSSQAQLDLSSGRLWSQLLRFKQEGFLFGDGSPSSSDVKVFSSSIVQGHGYSLLQIKEVDGHKLIQIRNPWANEVEWNGLWSDSSSKWTDRMRYKLKHAPQSKDGIFWMSWQDFQIHFRSIYVCRVYPPEMQYSVHGQWRGYSADDCQDYNSWHQNSQFRLRETGPDASYSIHVFITLTQGVSILEFLNEKISKLLSGDDTKAVQKIIISIGNMCVKETSAFNMKIAFDLIFSLCCSKVEDILIAAGEALSFLWGGVPVTSDVILKTNFISLSMPSNFLLGDTSMKKKLVDALVTTLTGFGKRERAIKLVEYSEVFQEVTIGESLSGRKLSTYKELSKQAGDALQQLLRVLIPRLRRYREELCLALADIIQGQKFDQVGKYLKKIRVVAFRAMDDIKETVRNGGDKLCRAVASLTIRLCDVSLTEASDVSQSMDIVLSILLAVGILSKFDSIKKALWELLASIIRRKNHGQSMVHFILKPKENMNQRLKAWGIKAGSKVLWFCKDRKRREQEHNQIPWMKLELENITVVNYIILPAQFSDFDPWGQGSSRGAGIVMVGEEEERKGEEGLGMDERGEKLGMDAQGLGIGKCKLGIEAREGHMINLPDELE
ncbi:hypothetical protein F3Y22_tig00111105pilonHSYRG00694 [Hibiscus syriacus]|uniref:Calpain catalytic domain-containing protein n=1 Tax=Hibiscus syriacus TaxID=106335 RepID=A0A6A2Z0D9_HIBSY|nr:hypothetical protein F3Y22_tig00111105pilonHSYRG00694 [Hibiscus syriacus]